MLNKIKEFLFGPPVDKSALNCDVYLHNATAVIIVVNSKGIIENIQELPSVGLTHPEGNIQFEYLGQL